MPKIIPCQLFQWCIGEILHLEWWPRSIMAEFWPLHCSHCIESLLAKKSWLGYYPLIIYLSDLSKSNQTKYPGPLSWDYILDIQYILYNIQYTSISSPTQPNSTLQTKPILSGQRAWLQATQFFIRVFDQKHQPLFEKSWTKPIHYRSTGRILAKIANHCFPSLDLDPDPDPNLQLLSLWLFDPTNLS